MINIIVDCIHSQYKYRVSFLSVSVCPSATPFAFSHGLKCCSASTVNAGVSPDCDGGYEDEDPCCTGTSAQCDASDDAVKCVSYQVQNCENRRQ